MPLFTLKSPKPLIFLNTLEKSQTYTVTFTGCWIQAVCMFIQLQLQI